MVEYLPTRSCCRVSERRLKCWQGISQSPRNKPGNRECPTTVPRSTSTQIPERKSSSAYPAKQPQTPKKIPAPKSPMSPRAIAAPACRITMTTAVMVARPPNRHSIPTSARPQPIVRPARPRVSSGGISESTIMLTNRVSKPQQPAVMSRARRHYRQLGTDVGCHCWLDQQC